MDRPPPSEPAGSSAAVLEAAARIEQLAPGYLDQVRQASGRLARHGSDFDHVRSLVADVNDAAQIDVEVPTRSRLRAGRVLKTAIKRLVGWYLRYLGDQVAQLGEAVVRLGDAVAERSETIEGRTKRLELDLATLEGRVARLEGEGG